MTCQLLIASFSGCGLHGKGGRRSREILPKRTGCIRVSSVIQCQATNVTIKINKDTPVTTVYLSDLSYVKTRWTTVDVAINMEVSSTKIY